MKRSQEIRSLTGLRGVTALLVVMFHTQLLTGIIDHRLGYIYEFVRHGYLAVDLFFVLSGYVLAMTYHTLFAGRFSWAAYVDFLTRRLARLYPLYGVASLAAACLLILKVNTSIAVTPHVLLANAAMIQSWGFGPSLNPPTWSLSAEWAAYLLFPLVAAVTLFSRWRIAAMAGVVAVAALAGLTWLPAAVTHPVGPAGALNIWAGVTAAPVARCIPEFLMGTLAWRLSGIARMAAIAASPWFSAGLATALVVLMPNPGTDVMIVCLMPMLVLGLACTQSGLSRFLAARPLHWLGEVSYSVYLLHYPMLWLASAVRPSLVTVPHSWSLIPVSAVAISIGLAAISYRWVERPGKRLVLRLLARPSVPVRNYA